MKSEKVICDGCGADLTRRSNSVDYRLVLASECKPGHGAGFYTDMMIYPSVNRPHHFCDLGCLDHWRDREKHYGRLRKELSDKWADEHGTKHGDGVRSYPCPPDEILKAWETDCRGAALTAFPIKHQIDRMFVWDNAANKFTAA